jgi:hypothetical protein
VDPFFFIFIHLKKRITQKYFYTPHAANVKTKSKIAIAARKPKAINFVQFSTNFIFFNNYLQKIT